VPGVSGLVLSIFLVSIDNLIYNIFRIMQKLSCQSIFLHGLICVEAMLVGILIAFRPSCGYGAIVHTAMAPAFLSRPFTPVPGCFGDGAAPGQGVHIKTPDTVVYVPNTATISISITLHQDLPPC
jgi:hypothetical protein